jgi:hypothetical protein
MAKVAKIIIILASLLLGFSYYQTKKLPSEDYLIDEMYNLPLQQKTDKRPFVVKVNDINYLIRPLFVYEVYGLVVSCHESAHWLDYYHARWKDSLNIKDLCLMWGNNLKSQIYKKMRFSSESWTCYYKFKPGISRQEVKMFRKSDFSNNHLLADSLEIKKMIMETNVGDQVYIKGYLAEYEHSGTFKRGTSTSRYDEGQGACETIFVNQYKVLKKANIVWHNLYRLSKYAIIAGVILIIISFFKSPLYNYKI